MTTPHQRAASPTPSQLPPIPASPTRSQFTPANPRLSSYFAANHSNANLLSLPTPPPPPRPPTTWVSQADLDASQVAYAELLSSAKTYRIALASLSTAASAFGLALESCARLKEARVDILHHPPTPAGGTSSMTASFSAAASGPIPQEGSACTADGLFATAGLHHLIANHEQILSETVYRAFEVPLLHELDKWRADIDDEQAAYKAAAKKQSLEIQRLERDGPKWMQQEKQNKKKVKGKSSNSRDVAAAANGTTTTAQNVAHMRSHLVDLTAKLDGLTTLHVEHSGTLLRESQDASVKVLDASCSLVRAEVDIFENLARKGWSGGGLEDLLEKATDLFASDPDDAAAAAALMSENGGGGGNGPLFSILPPSSILADGGGDDSSSDVGAGGVLGLSGSRLSLQYPHRRADSLNMLSDPYQSLTGMVSSGTEADSDFNRPRLMGPVRPFSPPPMMVEPDEEVLKKSGLHQDERENSVVQPWQHDGVGEDQVESADG